MTTGTVAAAPLLKAWIAAVLPSGVCYRTFRAGTPRRAA